MNLKQKIEYLKSKGWAEDTSLYYKYRKALGHKRWNLDSGIVFFYKNTHDAYAIQKLLEYKVENNEFKKMSNKDLYFCVVNDRPDDGEGHYTISGYIDKCLAEYELKERLIKTGFLKND
jgi:hypothetical protein